MKWVKDVVAMSGLMMAIVGVGLFDVRMAVVATGTLLFAGAVVYTLRAGK